MTTQTYYVRGFNPPVLVVKRDNGAAWVVPAVLPWAGARVVREDHLCETLLTSKEVV